MSAMNAHVGDAGVQEAACVVLRKLCVTPENQAQAGAAGAIEAVLQALQVHGYSSSLGGRRPLAGDDEGALTRIGAASRPTRRPQKCAALPSHSSLRSGRMFSALHYSPVLAFSVACEIPPFV